MSKYFHVDSLTNEIKKLQSQPFVALPMKDDVDIGACQRVVGTCSKRINIPVTMYTVKAITPNDDVMAFIIVENKVDNVGDKG